MAQNSSEIPNTLAPVPDMISNHQSVPALKHKMRHSINFKHNTHNLLKLKSTNLIPQTYRLELNQKPMDESKINENFIKNLERLKPKIRQKKVLFNDSAESNR